MRAADSEHLAALRQVARNTLAVVPPQGLALIDQAQAEFQEAVRDLDITPEDAEYVAALVVHAASLTSKTVWPDEEGRSAQLLTLLACMFIRPDATGEEVGSE